jgi:nucleotide-binding universal stress UspA family protein
MPGIIVGVDGSDNSRHALAWAMREAAKHDVPLRVLSVHPPSARPATKIYWGVHSYPENSFDPDLASMAVEDFVDKVASEAGGPVPEITVSVTTGDAAKELVQASHDADMLVVGSRGSGGFAALRMGSVSSQVTHHAGCPVVVVPPPAGSPRDEAAPGPGH